jgi:hypothetical protein
MQQEEAGKCQQRRGGVQAARAAADSDNRLE